MFSQLSPQAFQSNMKNSNLVCVYLSYQKSITIYLPRPALYWSIQRNYWEYPLEFCKLKVTVIMKKFPPDKIIVDNGIPILIYPLLHLNIISHVPCLLSWLLLFWTLNSHKYAYIAYQLLVIVDFYIILIKYYCYVTKFTLMIVLIIIVKTTFRYVSDHSLDEEKAVPGQSQVSQCCT